MYLCDNETCGSHCEVAYRPITTDGIMAWSFVRGLGGSVTKAQMLHFDPEAKFNLCATCDGVYGNMLERMRSLGKRMAERHA
jgi:hypothetical protein